MESEDIANLVIRMNVPLEYKYDKLASLKWRITKAIELDRNDIYSQLIEQTNGNTRSYMDR